VPAIAEQIAKAAGELPILFPDTSSSDAQRVADAAMEGIVFFYGRKPVTVGRGNIDWSGGHLNHQEWPAQLNRFFFLGGLCAVYRRTRREDYARCARDYIEDWIDRHRPYDVSDRRAPAGDSSLNMSIRLGGSVHPGWLGTLPGFVGSQAFDEPFLRKMVASAQWQLDWLRRNLRAWGNWRMAALDAILVNSLRLPELLGKHRQFAIEAVNVEFAGQVLPDGVHIERSGGYHEWMCDAFIRLWRLGGLAPGLGLRLDPAKIVRMHSYSLHHLKPNGDQSAFNDCSASYVTDDKSAGRLAARLQEHALAASRAGFPAEPAAPPHFAPFPDAGQVFYRTGWTTDDTWWSFDAAGCLSGHDHLSRLSLELHNGRRTTLIDPGIFDYEMSNPFASAGKSTPMHSTMNVNLLNQGPAVGGLLRAVELPGAVVAQGRYEGGYWPGQFKWVFQEGLGAGRFGCHDRTVIWLKDRAMIVLDAITHDADTAAYLHWASDEVPMELDADGMGMTTGHDGGNVRVRVASLCEAVASGTIVRGMRDPYLGWVKRGDDIVPAPLFEVRFSYARTSGPPPSTECASVIVPFRGNDPPVFHVETRVHDSIAREVKVAWADGSVDRIVFAERLAYPVRDCQDVHSDSLLVLVHTPTKGRPRVERLGGTFARLD